jgi:hypothetical protein
MIPFSFGKKLSAPRFCQNPSKNAGYPAPKKITAKAPPKWRVGVPRMAHLIDDKTVAKQQHEQTCQHWITNPTHWK